MHRDFNFGWVLDDLKDSLKQELDFVNEAKNGEKCAEDLRHLSFVYVPKIFWNYTSTVKIHKNLINNPNLTPNVFQRVLVTEFIDGVKISDLATLKAEGYSLAEVDKKLFRAFGAQIFQKGFVHADPHPGNGITSFKWSH